MLAAVVAAAAEEPRPTVTVHDSVGGVHALTEPEGRADVATRASALLDACSFHSTEDPEVFAGHDPREVWTATARTPHVRVRFAASFRPRHPRGTSRMVATEALVPLTVTGPLLWPVRNGDDVALLTKCDGVRGVELLCAPALRGHVPARELEGCAYLGLGADGRPALVTVWSEGGSGGSDLSWFVQVQVGGTARVRLARGDERQVTLSAALLERVRSLAARMPAAPATTAGELEPLAPLCQVVMHTADGVRRSFEIGPPLPSASPPSEARLRGHLLALVDAAEEVAGIPAGNDGCRR